MHQQNDFVISLSPSQYGTHRKSYGDFFFNKSTNEMFLLFSFSFINNLRGSLNFSSAWVDG